MNKYGQQVQASPMMSQMRFFSLEQANRSLVLIRRIVVDIVTGYRRLTDLQETLEAAGSGGTRQNCQAIRDEMIRLAGRLQSCMEELDDLGVELQDWVQGVVAFPYKTDGREVMLSWKHDEVSVTHWHPVGDPFTTRQPLHSLLMEEVVGRR